MMAKDGSNIVSLQAARKKAADEEVRRMKQKAASTGQGPLSKVQMIGLAAAAVLAFLAFQYFSGGGIQL